MKGSVENKRQKASSWVYCFWWSWLREGHAHSLGPHRFHRGSRDETGSLNDPLPDEAYPTRQQVVWIQSFPSPSLCLDDAPYKAAGRSDYTYSAMVIVRVKNFDLQSQVNRQCVDYVEVTNIYHKTRIICGRPRGYRGYVFQSPGYLGLTFKTDEANTRPGFKFSIEYQPSPCHQGPPGSRVKLDYLNVYTYYRRVCIRDWVLVNVESQIDFPPESSYMFCGKKQVTDLPTSSQERMLLAYHGVSATKADFIQAKHHMLAYAHRAARDDPTNTYGGDLSPQLHSSVQTSNLETSLRLLSLGADPNFYHKEKGCCLLHTAAQAGQTSQVELLIVYGAHPGTTHSQSNTPVHYTASMK
ncbi:hypothetical protein Pcinc_006804 [Petrolisthes cinctipes]|uniref:Uncharacterized protein n=1 Tax=Petrolisthes cinctipes TaxID=88211 RepID=A0AAE1GCA3_PETCI|nr:hypothetical protein Pcinc_006804 [Petrolisthes cinctipes]